MADAATASFDVLPSPSAWGQRVLAVTASAWQLAPRSAHALARRAPVGYVPRRARLRSATANPLLALAW